MGARKEARVEALSRKFFDFAQGRLRRIRRDKGASRNPKRYTGLNGASDKTCATRP